MGKDLGYVFAFFLLKCKVRLYQVFGAEMMVKKTA